MLVVLIPDHTICAKEYEEIPILAKKRATAYDLQGITCTGDQVRDGICASSDKSLIGKTIVMYQRLPNGRVGEIIGIYEVLDTGPMSEFVIDVWTENPQEFMNRVYSDGCGGKVFVQILEANG